MERAYICLFNISENCRKLPCLFVIVNGRFGPTNRVAQNVEKTVAKIKGIRYTLPDASRFRLYPSRPRVYLNGGGHPPRSRLLCAFEHVMIAVSSSTQEEEQVFPFFMVLSGCLNLEDVNSADAAAAKNKDKSWMQRAIDRRRRRRRRQDVWRIGSKSRDYVSRASRK